MNRMKPLLPSLKEKKRYVVFEVISETPVSEQDAYSAVETGLNGFIGLKGMAEAGLQFIRERWDAKKQRGIARIATNHTDNLKASFVFISSIGGKKVTVHSVGVSGTVDKAEKKYMYL